ncbi:hypothetical protein SRABI111_03731 [Pseudomonas carnis]|nr:hypothetical protein SRABI111_03731 [Pseudomonas carnis]CAH0323065.1 hypothetical protein SRABI08_05609 [Pseudomonas carnis]CAH0324604.1 hypothetical protein SRABI110_05975 [Pseudomonas carnis]CAH0325715.1 hypothetical protein SRABI64_05997 [Pseudomonas carnis]
MPAAQTLLNGICPYFTMFPLEFPQRILKRARKGDLVLDPFCGRGTTGFAARIAGLSSMGVDASPVASAITASKLVFVSAEEVINEARSILYSYPEVPTPQDEFWQWAYHPDVLQSICRLRQALLEDCSTTNRQALRGILLGALHGPQQKTIQSYFSNQCPRTYAPKPRYATNFWKERGMYPAKVDVLEVIARRALRYYTHQIKTVGVARLGDSREPESLEPHLSGRKYSWIITSPPYYGMKTYIPDQWLRNWFVGGTSSVQYESPLQLLHGGPEIFSSDLNKVWRNSAAVAADNARLVIRFGGISDRRADPVVLIKSSLNESGWKVTRIKTAGTAMEGKRQADSFLRVKSNPVVEIDVWATRD